MNAVPTIPIGARLVGSMGIAGEERGTTRVGRFGDRVAKRVLTMIPGLEAYSNHLEVLSTLVGTSLERELLTRSFHILSRQGSINIGPS